MPDGMRLFTISMFLCVYWSPKPKKLKVGDYCTGALADDDGEKLQQELEKIKETLSPVAKILRQETGFVLRNQSGKIIEHFGFVDGISQPLFLKRDIDRAKQRNDSFDQWDPRAPLNLVLAKDPQGKTPDSYGSYLVYRKLEQNVKGFRKQIRELAQALGITTELAEAYAMGRFRDGTPVTLSDTPDSDKNTNNFSYTADMQGSRCPFHAHIRKTNPRGDTGRITPPEVPLEEERMHRIARRGISYGNDNLEAEPETGSGLLFLCFQADIQNQFFFMQGLWSNSLNFVKPKVGRDPVIGQGAIFPDQTNQHFWPKQWGESDFAAFNFALWIKMKGGESFFSPSISFLKSLA
jgi:Dyp-type peroxidase family